MEVVVISALWCPSCLKMKKVYQELEKFLKINFLYLDIDFDSDEVSNYNNLDKLPILIIKNNGNEIKRIIGEHNFNDIKLEFKEFL